jgi:hypothetical protein
MRCVVDGQHACRVEATSTNSHYAPLSLPVLAPPSATCFTITLSCQHPDMLKNARTRCQPPSQDACRHVIRVTCCLSCSPNLSLPPAHEATARKTPPLSLTIMSHTSVRFTGHKMGRPTRIRDAILVSVFCRLTQN